MVGRLPPWPSRTLDGCAIDAPVALDEIFGPLVTLHPFESDNEAIEMANGTGYGLAASVWTSHLHRAHETRAELERSQIKKSNLIAASPYAASTSPHIIDIKGDGVVGSPSLGPSMVSSRT